MEHTVRIIFLAPADLRRKAKVKAAQTDQSLASVLREALQRWVEAEDEQAKAEIEGKASGAN